MSHDEEILEIVREHHARMEAMDLFGWPSYCTFSSLLLAPRLRRATGDPWRIAVGFGPDIPGNHSRSPHAWVELDGLAVCCTYQQFELMSRWRIGTLDELGFVRRAWLTEKEEREVGVFASIYPPEGHLSISTTMKKDWFAKMKPPPKLVISDKLPEPEVKRPTCKTCKGFANVPIGEPYKEDGHMICDTKECPDCFGGVEFPNPFPIPVSENT